MPDLDELLADPTKSRSLSALQASEISARLTARQLALAALQAILLERMHASEPSQDSRRAVTGDRMLTTEEVADRFRATKRWVYRHARKWPFTVPVGRKKLLFSEAGLNRYLAQRKG